jgi:hypothetical protein
MPYYSFPPIPSILPPLAYINPFAAYFLNLLSYLALYLFVSLLSRSFATPRCYFIQFISSVLSLEHIMRQQKKIVAEIFDAAESNYMGPVEETDINGDLVPKVLQPSTKVNYNWMIDLWDEYVSMSLKISGGYLLTIAIIGRIDTRRDILVPTFMICKC